MIGIILRCLYDLVKMVKRLPMCSFQVNWHFLDPMDGSPSLSETKVISYLEGGSSLPAYTAKRIVKAYPKGIRQDSSNFDPIPSWISGVQSVAMNMQTSGEHLDLVYGLFRINGNCGYVLKPEVLRNGLGTNKLEHPFV